MGLASFFRKYNIQIIILIIATFIWLHVKTEQDYEEVCQVKITPTNINPEYIITNNYTRTVPIRFQGKGKNLIALRNSDVELQVDFNQTSEKKFIAVLNLKNIRTSPQIGDVTAIEFVDKDTIEFYLNPLRYKKVKVEAQITIKPRAGFTQVGDTKITPSEINVSGPQDKINSGDIIKTKTLFLNDIFEDVDDWIELVNTFPDGVTLSSEEVEYSIDIQQIMEEKFDYIKVEVINAPKDLIVASVPSTLTLKVTGGIDVIRNLMKEDISAYIDFRRYDQNTKTKIPATIRTPDYVTISDIYPETFEIRINKLQ